MNIFFTSDTHFGHANIIRYCNRPFKDVTEMNETIISNWNNKVKANDIVYHLGDFCFGSSHDAVNIINRLNGSIHLIKGNHEKAALNIKNRFASIRDVDTFKIDKYEIFMSHYAHRVWNKSHRGTWHLYGHSHGTLPDDPRSLSFDIGVDCHNFQVLSFEEVKQIMLHKADQIHRCPKCMVMYNTVTDLNCPKCLNDKNI